MLRKNTTILLIFLLQSAILVAQESRFKEGETINVWASSGLNMRSKPDAKAEKLTTIPYGAKVVVLPNIGVKIPFEVEEFKGFIVKGYWLLVKYDNTEGFVFDGFLSRLPAPDKNENKDLLTFFEKEIGKIGSKYDLEIYDHKIKKYRKANKDEKDKEEDIVGFKQKIKNDIVYEIKPTDGGSDYSITLTNSTLFESYFLILTFFHIPNEELNNLDKREFDNKKKILHLSPIDEGVGCYFSIRKEAYKTVIKGYCGC
jgi:Bacterial SH3 domain